MSPLRYFVVDAFASRPFTGNPAAVVPLDHWPADQWLQNIALEMNLSETAYFVRRDQEFELRWFTPATEVDLCGHATLATAKVISHLGLWRSNSELVFASRSGPLRAQVREQSIELDFPLTPEQPAEPPAELIGSLGVTPKYVGRSSFDYLIEVETDDEVRGLTPDFNRLASVACRGVIVTARSQSPPYDFISRFFAPAAGVNEDPATGSAHCCLASYWQQQLGKSSFHAYQASARGGVLRVEVEGDRVRLGGQAFLFAEGVIHADYEVSHASS